MFDFLIAQGDGWSLLVDVSGCVHLQWGDADERVWPDLAACWRDLRDGGEILGAVVGGVDFGDFVSEASPAVPDGVVRAALRALEVAPREVKRGSCLFMGDDGKYCRVEWPDWRRKGAAR